ncbi:MAG: hypothetical protein GY869_16980, partial [Planctomycetes bacterium]|nr:hypothetical protein [Planctomycetota bacterium]
MSSKSLIVLTFLLIFGLAFMPAQADNGDNEGTRNDIGLTAGQMTDGLNIVNLMTGAGGPLTLGHSDNTATGEVAGRDSIVFNITTDIEITIDLNGNALIFADVFDDDNGVPAVPTQIHQSQMNPSGGVVFPPVAGTYVYEFFINISDYYAPPPDQGLQLPAGDADADSNRYEEFDGVVAGSAGLDLYLSFINNETNPGPPTEFRIGPPSITPDIAMIDVILYDSYEPKHDDAPQANYGGPYFAGTMGGTAGNVEYTGAALNYAGGTWLPVACDEEIAFYVEVYDPTDIASAALTRPVLTASGLDPLTATFYLDDAAVATGVVGAAGVGGPDGNATTVFQAGPFRPLYLGAGLHNLRFEISDMYGNRTSFVFPAIGGDGPVSARNWGAGVNNNFTVDLSLIPTIDVEVQFPFLFAESATGPTGPAGLGDGAAPDTTFTISTEYPNWTLGEGTDNSAAYPGWMMVADGIPGVSQANGLDAALADVEHENDESMYIALFSTLPGGAITRSTIAGGGAAFAPGDVVYGGAPCAGAAVEIYFVDRDYDDATLDGCIEVVAVDAAGPNEWVLLAYRTSGTESNGGTGGGFDFEDLVYDPSQTLNIAADHDSLVIGACDYTAPFVQRIYFDQEPPEITPAEWEYGTVIQALASSTCTPANGAGVSSNPNPYNAITAWEFGFNVNTAVGSDQSTVLANTASEW